MKELDFLTEVRYSGICHHYDKLKEKGESPEECLRKTAIFARASEKETEDILRGNY